MIEYIRHIIQRAIRWIPGLLNRTNKVYVSPFHESLHESLHTVRITREYRKTAYFYHYKIKHPPPPPDCVVWNISKAGIE